MKKILTLFCALLFANISFAQEPTLVDVFNQALTNDPIYLQSIAQRLSDREGVPISLSALLPAASISASAPQISRTLNSGAASSTRSGSSRGYTMTLNLSQTVFDFGKLSTFAAQKSLANSADAALNAATQDLIIRVAKAYFQVLEDQDNLIYIRSTRTAFARQLDQVKQQYNVGLKTITNVYTAKASYETSVANYIGAEATLATDRENLRTITNQLYPTLAKLREDFPLVTPTPAKVDDWVTTAGKQNWSVRQAQYIAAAKRSLIQKQFAGHLPTVELDGSWQDQFSRTSSSNVFSRSGASRSETSSAAISINIPLLSGGGVIAATHQAQYDYQVALQQLEAELRKTLTQTRQSYLNIVAGISKIHADRQTIKSSSSSLKGMEAAYQVGTETLVDVLNQQQNVYQAKQQYASDRYSYVNNLLALKQAAGTLSLDDLVAITAWLEKEKTK